MEEARFFILKAEMSKSKDWMSDHLTKYFFFDRDKIRRREAIRKIKEEMYKEYKIKRIDTVACSSEEIK